jgi:hypothetical protein
MTVKIDFIIYDFKVGKMELEEGRSLESMQLYQDDAKDCHYVIFKHRYR